ncbi:hypothetical protein JZU46_06605 [bacterium]|nr:hypothetical protein [bacterium]
MRKKAFRQLKFDRASALEKWRWAEKAYGKGHPTTLYFKEKYEKLDDQHLHTF